MGLEDMMEDMKIGMATFAVILISFLSIGGLAGFSFKELSIIGISWAFIAVCWAFLSTTVGEWFEQIQPLLLALALGLAWYCVWEPIQRLAVSKAGYAAVIFDELPWWSSLSFKLVVLVVLLGGGYGFGYLRANR